MNKSLIITHRDTPPSSPKTLIRSRNEALKEMLAIDRNTDPHSKLRILGTSVLGNEHSFYYRLITPNAYLNLENTDYHSIQEAFAGIEQTYNDETVIKPIDYILHGGDKLQFIINYLTRLEYGEYNV